MTLRRPAWGIGMAACSSVLMMGVVMHLKDLAEFTGKSLPAKYDIFVRMRGWDQVLAQIKQGVPPHLPVATDSRAWSAQIAYQWRDTNVMPHAWNPQRHVSNYYQMTTDLNALKGQDLLLLAEQAPSSNLSAYASSVEDMGEVRVDIAPNRQLMLHAWVLRGFRGY
jgi:hypothetical protein